MADLTSPRGAGLDAVLLPDTSAWHRSRHPDVIDDWSRALVEDQIAVTPPVRLEVLYSARNAADYVARVADLDALRQVACGSSAFARALAVQRALAERGGLLHRSVKLVDLLIAAAAELGGVTVWHYDSDFDRVAEITGQPTRWIAPRGSL